MVKDILYRLKREIEYLSMKDWSFQDVAKFWDSIFDYEDINKETYSYFRRFTDSYRLCYPIPQNSYLIDICCRTGNGTLFFWQKGKIKKAICADVSSFMLNICEKKLSSKNAIFETQIFDSYSLPFSDEEFDVVLSLETVEHVSKAAIFIKELGRITKGGGQMILSTPNTLWEPIHSLAAVFNIHHSEGPHRFIKRDNLYRYICDAGFDIVTEETTVLIPGGPKFLVRFGEWLEQKIRKRLRSVLGLRRIFICRKKKR